MTTCTEHAPKYGLNTAVKPASSSAEAGKETRIPLAPCIRGITVNAEHIKIIIT